MGIGGQGLGIRIRGLGFRVSGLGFGVWGFRFGVEGYLLLEDAHEEPRARGQKVRPVPLITMDHSNDHSNLLWTIVNTMVICYGP